jgi:(4-(4-[2-(gamma-L-glutamylamino)ethyl]phenoxymethyl)furan-2-yl)methanamine synthase
LLLCYKPTRVFETQLNKRPEFNMPDILGLDIGGANLKAAHSGGAARTVPFALWKNPQGLSAAVRAVMAVMPPHDVLAVTMTGELCDCFTSKREGVDAILACVQDVAGRAPVRVWTTYGQFLRLQEARQEPLRVAAANWLAAASLAGRYAKDGAALYLDIGSTTTDIIELWNGKPVPSAWTDVDRLKWDELVYTGVRRTPVCALLGPKVAAEFFATTLDVYLVLGLIPEDEEDCNTADNRPAAKTWANARLARMLGGDGETVEEQEILQLAQQASDRQIAIIDEAIQQIRKRMPEPLHGIVISGSGEFLARQIVASYGFPVVSLGEQLGPQISEAICAYAVATLAKSENEYAESAIR